MQFQEVTEHFSLDRVVPFFQPIMDLQSDSVWRYECLARLVMPDEQTFLPSEFLHLVERQQSVAQLTETIFYRSAEYFRDFNVAWSINISEADLLNPDLLPMLKDFLNGYPNARRICIELTADTACDYPAEFATFVADSQHLNIGIILDHLTHPRKELEHILSLPIFAIKLDSKSLCNDDQDAFANTMYDMAIAKGINVIAEHVEDRETLTELKTRSIRFAQGYYFCQPLAQT